MNVNTVEREGEEEFDCDTNFKYRPQYLSWVKRGGEDTVQLWTVLRGRVNG